jgi:predicted pyridoxine 5'-phosphate oxidase superfamily flavin-nucleotide-binding protein
MGILTDDMKEMLAYCRLTYVATVTPEGRPNLSPKASTKVLDDDHLVFVDIASPNTIRNLKSNPYVEVNVVDPLRRRGYRFKGVAEILTEGDLYNAVAEDFWTREGRQYPANGIVTIRVEKALPVLSPAYTFNEGVREENVRRLYLQRYGLQDASVSEKSSAAAEYTAAKARS